jgi:ferrochelatase
MKSGIDAVFFISFGGPTKKDEIRPFLENVTRGRRIPPERIDEVVRHYELIGGASPINAITDRQAKGLQKVLAESGSPLPVYVGNRNWKPLIADTLKKMAQDGVRRAAGFIAAAHRCEASWERYINAAEEARKPLGSDAPKIDYVEPWFDHPLFIEAVAARVEETLRLVAGNPNRKALMPWIFTAHSIPRTMAETSNYEAEFARTCGLVAEKLGKKEWTLAYQSRSGRPEDPWLEPDVCEVIRRLAKSKEAQVKDILIIPAGFLADHVEVLYDLDVEAKGTCKRLGVKYHRAPTVGDHPLFLRMTADVAGATHEAISR